MKRFQLNIKIVLMSVALAGLGIGVFSYVHMHNAMARAQHYLLLARDMEQLAQRAEASHSKRTIDAEAALFQVRYFRARAEEYRRAAGLQQSGPQGAAEARGSGEILRDFLSGKGEKDR
jgi:hypothetical protein